LGKFILFRSDTSPPEITVQCISFSFISGRKIGLRQRSTLQDAISAHAVGGIVRLTRFIIKGTILVELLGALLLMPVFIPEFGIKGIWYSFFHSISAFCNAGFDLMGIRENFSSLTTLSSNVLLNIVIMSLIVLGGLGFLTWDDIRTHKLRIKKYKLQSKVILLVSFTLIIIPAIFNFVFEFSNEALGERILLSLFQSITTRTAGFNTADLNLMSSGGIAIMICLMLVGGSPGSTAGGMKTTTLGVIFFSALSVFKRKPDAECFGRRIPLEAVRNAATILGMYLVLFLGSGITISIIEALPLKECLFETASAIGTVGLTLGITPSLSSASLCILMLLMFFGRVGGLTLIYAALTASHNGLARLPQEKITVG